jgi:hypothetical protein
MDDSNDTTAVDGTVLSTTATATSGSHTLHVKAWSSDNTACSADVTVSVQAAATAPAQSSSIIPANATTVGDIQNLTEWTAVHDAQAGGDSSGVMSVVDTPSLSGHARQFDTTFSDNGGELYTDSFDIDVNATNFFYDAYVYLTDSVDNLANLEMDMNQVLADGHTVIFGFQCDGWTGRWDYTVNQGTAESPDDQWVSSSAYCDARTWSRDVWHHVQVWYSRDDSGNVSYHSVWLDGVESKLDTTVPSAFALGWAPALQVNFQVDGYGSGSNTVYLDKLTVSRW